MKNLKKIIVAVLVLAALVTAVVITALASDGDEVSYTGKVAEARELLDQLDGLEADSEKSAVLVNVNKYFTEKPIDPSEEGYDELMLDYSKKTLAVAQNLLGRVNSAADDEAKIVILMEVYAHYKGAPVYEYFEDLDEDGYNAWRIFQRNYSTETVRICTAYLKPIEMAEDLDGQMKALHELADLFNKMHVAYHYKDEALYEVPGFNEFIAKYNDWCMSVGNGLVERAKTPAEMTQAYKNYKKATSHNQYNTSSTWFYDSYLEFTAAFDTKNIAFATELLADVDTTVEDYTVATAKLKVVYDYLSSTPCFNRSALADTIGVLYSEFSAELNKCTYDLTLRYYAKIESLVGGEDAEFSKAVSDFLGFLKDCPALLYRDTAPEGYTGDLEEALELLSAVEAENAALLENYAALYAYLSKNAVDPSAEGAAEFYDEYALLKLKVSNYVVTAVQSLNSAPTVKGGEEIDEAAFLKELKKLQEISEFLKTTPVSSVAINEYNSVLPAFLATAEELWCEKLEYKAPEAGDAAGDLTAAEALLKLVDLKAENALEAYAELYAYLVKNPVDPAAAGAAEFYKAFAELSAELSDAICSSIASIAPAPSYIAIFANDCPTLTYSVPAVLSLTGSVETANGLVDAVNSLISEDAEISAIFEAYTILYKCNYKTAVKPGLEGAADYKKAFDALTLNVSKLVVETLKSLDSAPKLEESETVDTDSLKASVEVLSTVAKFLKSAPVTEAAVNEYNATVAKFYAAINASYGSELDEERFIADLGKLSDIKAYLETTPSESVIALYNAKADACLAGIAASYSPLLSYKPLAAEKLDGKLDEATALLNAVKGVDESKLEAYAALYAYLKENALDPSVDGVEAFYAEYESLTLSISAYIIEEIAKLDSNPSDFDGKCPEIVYTVVESISYKGELAEANALLTKLRYALGDINADLDEILVSYKALYDYLFKTAIDSSLEGAEAFYATYEAVTNEVNAYVLASLAALDAEPTYEKLLKAHKYDALTYSDYAFAEAGVLKEALTLYNAVKLDSDDALEKYALLYEYMVNKGVSSAEAGADEFLNNLAALTAQISEKVCDDIAALNALPSDPETATLDLTALKLEILKVEKMSELLKVAPTSPEVIDAFNAKLDEFKSSISAYCLAEINEAAFNTQRSALETLYSFIAATRISEDAVNAYNEVRHSFNNTVVKLGTEPIDKDAFNEELANLRKISSFLATTPVSLAAINEYNDVLHGFTVALKGNFDDIYAGFTGYKAELDAFIKKYPVDADALPEDIDYDSFTELIDSLSNYAVIKSVTDYIYTSEFDSFGVKLISVDEYRAKFARALNDIIAAALLEYEAPAEPDSYSGTITAAQAILDQYAAATDNAVKTQKYAELYEYMKNNPLNPRLDGYDAFMLSYTTAGEEVYKILLANIDSATDSTAAITAMHDYLVAVPISQAAVNAYNMKYMFTYKTELETALAAYSKATAKLHDFIANSDNDELIASIEGLTEVLDNYESLEIVALVQFYKMQSLEDDPNATTVSVVERGHSIKTLNNYVRNYPISESAFAYEETMADIEYAQGSYEALLEAAKQALDDMAPLDEYRNDTYDVTHNWDDGVNNLGFTWSDNAEGTNTGTRFDVMDDTARGGKYLKLTYGDKEDQGNSPTKAFFGTGGLISDDGLVIEFDLTGDDGVAYFAFNRLDRSTGSPIQRGFFKIRDNKFYTVVDNVESTNAWKDMEVITPGEWTKFIFVYDPENVTLTGYIDYELVGTWSVKTDNPADTLVEYRANAAEVNTSVNIDNFSIYQGSSFRIKDKFDSMDLAAKFTYFVDYMHDSTRKPTTRLQAYQQATTLLEDVKADAALSESLAAVIEKYNSIDRENDIIKPAMDANLVTLKGYTAELDAYNGIVNTQNSTEVQLIISNIETFINANADYLDKDSEEYKNASASLSRFKTLIARSETLTSFVNSLKRFDRAYTLAAKNKHYETATQYYDLGEFYNEQTRLSVMSDPEVIAFEKAINGELPSDDENYVDIFEYYANCRGVIDAQELVENSERIIDCVGFIKGLEGYEGTEEFWQANFDFINRYMNIIRNVVRINAYDPTYEGVNEAIAEFREIDVYFYAILQNDHIKVIGEQLAKYDKTDSYIEKLGICTYVKNYINANDIDSKNTELQALVLKNDTYSLELEKYINEYAVILEQNTAKFINTVEEMKTYVGYAELDALYKEALNYYYEMNLTDAAKAAVEVFEQYANMLEETAANSAIFIGYASKLESARSDAALYQALVNCHKYLDKISEDVSGVEDALETYEEKLAEYNAMADTVNSSISEINGVVSAVRTNRIAEAIMTVINKIFNR